MADPRGTMSNDISYGTQPATPYPADRSGYAHWGKRVGARLLDTLLAFVSCLPLLIGTVVLFSTSTTTVTDDGIDHAEVSSGDNTLGVIVFVVGLLIAIGFNVWNDIIRQGRTGCTLGKSAVGITVIKESTGRPTGAWLALGRQILHAVDGALFYLGYLWPLWDRKRQTFADKIVETVVVNTPR
jgi:uncharacterized RDD family membrane protein YckC